MQPTRRAAGIKLHQTPLQAFIQEISLNLSGGCDLFLPHSKTSHQSAHHQPDLAG